MAVHWRINFHSLRAGTHYTVNIYDATYTTGSPIELKGGAQPFTTQEDENDDPFIPVRTQSGYIRIVDDGLDANGNAWNWKTLLPATDTDRPVSLTKTEGNTTTIEWMGFMQAQNFGGTLYGNPQEREFPVQCCVSVLNAFKVSTDADALHNFAYILYNFMVTNMPQHSFTSFVIQGGNDARRWLLKKLDWQNFLNESDEEDLVPRYTHKDVIEDVCRFWGWTIRTKGQTVYLTCADDANEQTWLTLSAAQLQSLANETSTSAGSVSNMGTPIAMSGDIFASVNNDDFKDRGPNKATVKADINEHDSVMKVFPPSVRNELNATGWTWVSGGEDKVGYFETSQIGSFDTELMQGYGNSSYGMFSRRQVYTTSESDDASECDMILINHVYNGTQFASVQTKKPMTFANGTLKISGTVYFDSYVCDWEEGTNLRMRLGIGATRQTARWWYMNDLVDVPPISNLDYGWTAQGTLAEFGAPCAAGNIKSTGFMLSVGGITLKNNAYDGIPTYITGKDNSNMYGKLFIDILGLKSDQGTYRQTFQIADLKVEFFRDLIELPTQVAQVRGRVKLEDRVSSKEYTSENANMAKSEWNADCIFASDNHMNYGYGLVLEPTGEFMSTASYGNNATAEHPEQHLANRVTTYWASAKRRLGVELRSNVIIEPTPANKVTLDGTTLYPLAISHDWRDDVTKLTLIQM